ncbi:hypothetical protein GOODEAATRI_012149 [Goodea atripinnis]|uniref:Uncharacterized protein n=1 Tax=Goodea atripinnis TaxID=208336 RepID=A0ABV0NU03_9TELE
MQYLEKHLHPLIFCTCNRLWLIYKDYVHNGKQVQKCCRPPYLNENVVCAAGRHHGQFGRAEWEKVIIIIRVGRRNIIMHFLKTVEKEKIKDKRLNINHKTSKRSPISC